MVDGDPSQQPPSSIGQKLNVPLLVFVYAVSGLLLVLHARSLISSGGDPWRQGDWLINYSAGPVRRGISGEFFLALSQTWNVDPLALVVGVQLCISLLIAGVLLRKAVRLNAPDHLTIALLAPTLVVFWVNDPGAMFRKEILYFLALAPLTFEIGSRSKEFFVSASAILIYAIAVAFHESTAFFAGFLVLAFITRYREALPLARIGTIAAIAAIGVLYAVSFASVPDTAPICNRLIAAGLDARICSGIIVFLQEGVAGNFEVVAANFEASSIAEGLSVGILCLMPTAYLLIYSPRTVRILQIALASILLMPLFLLSIDWGRWLSAFAFSVVMLLLVPNNGRPVRATFPLPLYILGLVVFLSVGLNHSVVLFADGFAVSLTKTLISLFGG